jgi:hypothetical protein
MGFKLNRTYLLNFQDSDLEGAQIRLRATSVGTLMRINDLFERAKTGDVAYAERGINEILVEHIVEWNLEDADGEALEVSVDSILLLEASFLSMITEQWMKAARGIPAPLEQKLNDGDTSKEE